MTTKKSIFLIGANPDDFNDITYRSLSSLKKSDCIVISKVFKNSFLKILKQFDIPIFFEEKISRDEKDQENLWKNMELLFEKYNRIAHVKKNDPIIFNDGIKEFNYFKERFKVEFQPGIINVVSFLNKLKISLTDRRLNSVVYFYDFINEDLNLDFSSLKFEKVILRINETINDKQLFGNLNKLKLRYEISILFFEDNLLFNIFDESSKEQIKHNLCKKNNVFLIFNKKNETI